MNIRSALHSLAASTRRPRPIELDQVAGFFVLRFADAPRAASAIEDVRRSMIAIEHTAERYSTGHYFAAKIVVGLAVKAEAPPRELAQALLVCQRDCGLSAFRVALRLLSDPELLELRLDDLTELCMSLLLAVAPVEEVSIWRRRGAGAPTVLHSGGRRPSPSAAKCAALALDDADGEPKTAPHTAPIRCWHRPVAVVAWTPRPDGEFEANVLAERVAALLGPAFDRVSLVESNLERASALVSSAERRLTRLSFDLHDGPLQDVALMSARIAELRRRLDDALPRDPDGDRTRESFDDLAALIEFLDNDLRQLASSLDAPVLVQRPFADVLDAIVRKFASRNSIEVDTTVDGDVDNLSESQRIALVRVVQEALTNVGDHSAAHAVRISIAAGSRRVEAAIEDDGIGFDVDEAMRSAGRAGRMGLLGMVERIRLLGGSCLIESEVGHGSRIALTMARWDRAEQAPVSNSFVA